MGNVQNGGLHGGTIPVEQVRQIVEQAAQNYHVIGAMSFGEIPVGHSVVMNVLKANPDTKTGGDVYDVGGERFGLTGNFLNALADSAGVSVVDSKLIVYQANYCIVETTVARMGLDGSVRRISRRKVMDLREGSGQLKAMRDAAKAKSKDAATQVREQRLRIAEHADSKAALRAIRAILSVRTYTQEELKKPFAIFKLQFTGTTNDPALRQIFAIGLMQASLGAMGALFGAPASTLLPGPAPMLAGGGGQPLMLGAASLGAGAAPPDMGDGIPDEDDLPPGGNEAAAAPPRVTAGDSRKVYMPGRKGEAPTIYEADNDSLIKAEKRGRENMLGGKWEEKYRDSNLRQLLTMRKEMRFRKLPVELCADLGDDPAPVGPRGGAQAPAAAEQRPPSDGPPKDTRTADQRLADDAFGHDEGDDHES